MNIGIIDADLLNRAYSIFPNLALMKLSSYYKKLGHTVTLIHFNDINPNNIFCKKYDKVFISKVFTDTKVPSYMFDVPFIEYGGTGFFFDKAPRLPHKIEHSFPDYHLYDKWIKNEMRFHGREKKYFKYFTDFSIGFTCYDKETEVLTKDGWKFFKDVTLRDTVATLNQNTQNIEYHKPNEIVKVPYKGDLLHFKNKYVDLLVTPNHNMFCGLPNKDYKLIRADKISKYYQYRFKKDANYKEVEYKRYFELESPEQRQVTSNVIKDKLLMNDWLEFLGYFLSEGSCNFKENSNSYIVRIAQNKNCPKKSLNKGDVFSKIRSCIERLGFNFYENDNDGFSISNKQLYTYLKQFGLQHERFIPDFIKNLNKEQINIFIDAYILGDGVLYKRKDGLFTKGIISTSKRIIDDFQLLFLTIGECGDIKFHGRKGAVKYIGERKIVAKYDCYHIFMNAFYKNPTYSKQQSVVNNIPYDDFVYCCEVKNHILYVRRNGIATWCGNTRGCFRHCAFCVNKNEDKVYIHSPLSEFVDDSRKKICLWDDNILGSPAWESVLLALQATGKPFLFKQGLDIRILTEKKARMLSESKYEGNFVFAFDNIADKEMIIKKLTLWKKYTRKSNPCAVLFCFCCFDINEVYDMDFWLQDSIDLLARIKILMEFGARPYIMQFEKHKVNPLHELYDSIKSWCNSGSCFQKQSLRDFCKSHKSLPMLKDFEKKHPDIAKKYFDIKYTDYVPIKEE